MAIQVERGEHISGTARKKSWWSCSSFGCRRCSGWDVEGRRGRGQLSYLRLPDTSAHLGRSEKSSAANSVLDLWAFSPRHVEMYTCEMYIFLFIYSNEKLKRVMNGHNYNQVIPIRRVI